MLTALILPDGKWATMMTMAVVMRLSVLDARGAIVSGSLIA